MNWSYPKYVDDDSGEKEKAAVYSTAAFKGLAKSATS
jgi:hypothetical protein